MSISADEVDEFVILLGGTLEFPGFGNTRTVGRYFMTESLRNVLNQQKTLNRDHDFNK